MRLIMLATLYAAIAAVEGWQGPGTRGGAGEIGPYQITRGYWQDARMPDGAFEDCEKPEYARRVMIRYWQRYCPGALERGEVGTLASVHHWGPKGVRQIWRRRDDYVERVINLATPHAE